MTARRSGRLGRSDGGASGGRGSTRNSGRSSRTSGGSSRDDARRNGRGSGRDARNGRASARDSSRGSRNSDQQLYYILGGVGGVVLVMLVIVMASGSSTPHRSPGVERHTTMTVVPPKPTDWYAVGRKRGLDWLSKAGARHHGVKFERQMLKNIAYGMTGERPYVNSGINTGDGVQKFEAGFCDAVLGSQ